MRREKDLRLGRIGELVDDGGHRSSGIRESDIRHLRLSARFGPEKASRDGLRSAGDHCALIALGAVQAHHTIRAFGNANNSTSTESNA
jgi:hypothetical protein